jgi:hypothetical protein
VFGFSWRVAARGGLLSSQNFVDAGTFRSGNTVFTGVPVGAATYLPGSFFTPQVALANFGTKPVSATVLFARTTDSGPEPSNVATVSVPAMSSQTIALPLLTGDPGLRNSFIVQSDAAPGTLFASVAAVGAPGFGLVEQIGKDQQTTANGGGHPWDLTGGQGAVLLLFNHSTVPKYFNVKIGNGGVLWQQPYQLAPMETRAVSIRELISGQVKDQDGKVLSRSLEQGEIGWFNANPAEGKGRLMQIDPATQTVAGNARVARNFSCGYYYNLCGAYLYVDSITLNYEESSSPASLGQVIPMICTNGDDGGCSGQSSSHSGLGYTYNWLSNTPSIATVYGSSTSSTATFWGEGPGTGSATGQISSLGCIFGAPGTPTVTKPTALAYVGQNAQGAANCPAGQNGFSRQITLQVVDQNGNPSPIQNFTMSDVITVGSPNGLGITGTQTGSLANVSGPFLDSLYVCSAACPASNSSTTGLQTWTGSGPSAYYPLGTYNVVYKCNSIAWSGH